MSNEKPVGYGNPPKHTRFNKGQSGNPSGRPKKAPSFEEDLQKVLAERIEIVERGRKKRITLQLAVVKSLASRAIKGHAPSAALVAKLASQTDPEAGGELTVEAPLSPAEQAAYDEMLERGARRKFEEQKALLEALNAPRERKGPKP